MSVLVIDALEMIDVDDEAAYRPAGLCRLRDGTADLGIEAAAVEKPREAVAAALLEESLVAAGS